MWTFQPSYPSSGQGSFHLNPFANCLRSIVLRRATGRWRGQYFAAPMLWGLLELIRAAFCSTPSTKHGNPARTAGRARQKMGCYRSCSHFKLAFLFCGICFQLGQLRDLDKHRSFHIQGRRLEQIQRVRKR